MKLPLQSFHVQLGRHVYSPVNTKISLVLFLCIVVRATFSQYLTVIPVLEPDFNVSSEDHDYRQKNLDIIWNISFPAEVKISKFDVDMLAGDFVIVCQYSLPNDPRLGTGAAAEDVVHLLPVEDSLLLSPELFPSKSPPEQEDERIDDTILIRISSPHGGFIYFHALMETVTNFDSLMGNPNESLTSPSSSSDVVQNTLNQSPSQVHQFEGFHMQISFLELNPTPIVPSTTEKLTTPAPGVDIYIQKYVIGKSPGDFYRDLASFKSKLADMGNAYCDLKNNCLLFRPIESSNKTDDVRLTKEMIFFCERDTPYYDTCVQVKFAITIRNIYDQYVMTSDKLEEMWALFAKEFLSQIPGPELQPYEPGLGDENMVTWIWVAAALGSILALSSILCFTLVGNHAFQAHSPDEQDVNQALHGKQENIHTPGSSVNFHGVHGKHPILKIIQSMNRQQTEEETYGMYNLDLDRDFAERNKNDLRPINELLGQGHQGHLNQAYIPDDDDEIVLWRSHPSKTREFHGSHHTFSPPMETFDDSDEAIEIDNEFYSSSNGN